MARTQGKSGLIVTIIALGLTLVIISTIVILQNANRTNTTDQAATTETKKEEETPAATSTDEEAKKDEPAVTTVDPATLSSVDIEPLGITVFYTKGTPGFDFLIKKTADRTQYAEFSSQSLVGTKCTNDEGVFASIIKNPASSEDQSTFSQKKTIGSDTYALSLTGTNCTSNVELLKEYQTAFTNGFSNLKAME